METTPPFLPQSSQTSLEISLVLITLSFLPKSIIQTVFLLNLSEEFDDDEHEQLVRTAMLLREGFRLAALNVQSITSVIIQDVTKEVVENIEKIDTPGGAPLDEMVKTSRSPFVFSELRNFLHQELKNGLRERKGQQHNLMVLVDILIGCFEEAVEIPEAKKSE